MANWTRDAASWRTSCLASRHKQLFMAGGRQCRRVISEHGPGQRHMRHFLDLLDLSRDELAHLLERTAKLKAAHAASNRTPILQGRVIGLVFEKPSLRTRVSFQTAMAQLG